MNKVRSYVVNLVLLGLICLVVEQVSYCLWIPGYSIKLVTCPVFWGSFSGICFLALWRMNSSDKHSALTNEEGDEFFYFMYNNPMSFANPNNMLPRNLGGWW